MEFMELIKTPKVENVVFKRSSNHKKMIGTLCLTSHHLLFVDRSTNSQEEELMVNKINYFNYYILTKIKVL